MSSVREENATGWHGLGRDIVYGTRGVLACVMGRNLRIFAADHLHLGMSPDRNSSKPFRRAAATQQLTVIRKGSKELAPTSLCRQKGQLNMGDFIGSIPFFILLAVVLIGLVVLLLYLRKKGEED